MVRRVVRRLLLVRAFRVGLALGVVAARLVWAGIVSAGTAAWKVQTSPHGGSDAVLNGVAAISSSDAWAVGYFSKRARGPVHTLIEHWNGKTWQVKPGPNPASFDDALYAAAVISATDAWAVGYYVSRNGAGRYRYRTLVEHWNSKAWRARPGPNPSSGAAFLGVAATSATNAWAVGDYSHGTGTRRSSSTAADPVPRQVASQAVQQAATPAATTLALQRLHSCLH